MSICLGPVRAPYLHLKWPFSSFTDCYRFCAALTGMPVLLREADVQTEYPVDVDDENVTENGFLPTLPGESTRISSALAFFGASRILNQVLEDMYPSRAGYDVSVSKMRSVAIQLDEWLHTLPAHLRLEFSQDKPSTNVTSSRSPLLVSSATNRLYSQNANTFPVARVLLHSIFDSSPCRVLR